MPETIRAMIERGANIRWECEVKFPGHSGDVNLKAIAQAKGGAFTLANRRPACRVRGCPGRVRFMDFTGAWPRALDTLTHKDDAWWAYAKAEGDRMEALGWRMVGGYWQAPETTKGPPSEESGPR